MTVASTSAQPIEAETSATASINGQHVEVELDSIEDALKAIAAGEILVVVDDMDRENEGDLIIAASQCTTEKMAWIVRWSRWAETAEATTRLNQNVRMLTLLCFCFLAGTSVQQFRQRG